MPKKEVRISSISKTVLSGMAQNKAATVASEVTVPGKKGKNPRPPAEVSRRAPQKAGAEYFKDSAICG